MGGEGSEWGEKSVPVSPRKHRNFMLLPPSFNMDSSVPSSCASAPFEFRATATASYNFRYILPWFPRPSFQGRHS